MNTRTQRGFTIIEVVLVLAIAGLIFLMVFIALPALQKGQRDTQRRNDVSRFRAQVNQYQANRKGVVPGALVADMTSFQTSYLDGSGGWKDPKTGNDYPFVEWANGTQTFVGKLGTSDADSGKWTYLNNARCSDDGTTFTTGTGTRTYAVAMKLEGSGYTCQDNQ